MPTGGGPRARASIAFSTSRAEGVLEANEAAGMQRMGKTLVVYV